LTPATFDDFQKLVTHFSIFNGIELRKDQFNAELDFYFICTKLLLNVGNELARTAMIMDFTDMIYLPVEWKLSVSVKYDFLFIDECQDLSRAQLAVVSKYGHEKSRILAVGDPRQSIYGFTGADIESFERVKSITGALQFPLTSCFRCPQSVIELAKTIRSDIVGTKTEGGLVATITEDKILEFAKTGDLVISRLRAPLIVLVFSFIDKERKVQIHEDDVKDIVNEIKNIFKHEELHLQLSKAEGDFHELKEVVIKRWEWIIRKDAERIVNSMERTLYIEDQQTYLKQKLEFLHRKYEQWKLSCPTLSHIVERIREFVSATSDAVKLSTIHKAKGLENDRVFVLDYDELPLQHLEQKEWEKVQELNLKYVAITRAKKELFLVESPKVEVLKEKSLFDILPFDH
jgi:DNA helicase-2/ATP-dependent DNA helicase PcrA